MKKKILSLILVAAMLASMLVFAPVSGATTDAKATIDVTETAGFAGNTVSVDVIMKVNALDGENPIISFSGLIEYDRSRLTLESAIRSDFWNQSPGTDATDANANGKYASFVADGWQSLTGLDGGDASEGVVGFTLTFTIKENAPLGDAYVKFHYVGNNASLLQYNTVVADYLNKPGDINFIDGKVTVLDGMAPATDPSEFGFVDNEDGTCIVTEYFGDATILTIPSEINGLTVVGIGSMIFCEVDHDTFKISKTSEILENNTVRTIIVPATVTTIAEWAFMNANVCENVIVLGDALEYVSGTAFGCVGGTWKSATTGATTNRGKFNEDAWMLGDNVDDDGYQLVENVKLTIVNADSLGADFEAESGLEGNCVKFETKLLGEIKVADLTLTIGEETVNYTAFGAAIKAPIFGGVVAWTDAEGNYYAPGADIGDATELTAVTVTAPVGSSDVTAKVTDKFAMRFSATFTKDTYDAMAALGTVKMGMLITPRQYVVKAGNLFTKEALDAFVEGTGYAGYVDVAVPGAYKAYDVNGEETTVFEDAVTFEIVGALSDLKQSTATKDPDFVAVGYLEVTTASGDVVTVYSAYDYLAAMKVSTFLDTVDTNGLGDTELGWIQTWKDLFN